MRILHTMLRVGDLQRSIDFYTRVLGMKLLRKSENTEYKYTLAFVGYGDEKDEAVIELTYNWGVEQYDPGTAFGHIALEAEDIYATCEAIRAAGGTITREPGGLRVTHAAGSELFDQAVLACHSDQALAILGNTANESQRRLLSAIRFRYLDLY